VVEGQPGINRREFLTYAWGAAMGLLTLGGGYATYDFLYPRFREGEFGGKFVAGLASSLPGLGQPPRGEPDGKYWLVDTEQGPKALYMVCTHLGCLYKWEPSTFQFECPCHGSKFTVDGHYIEGPADRSLDEFVIEIVQNGQVVGQTEETAQAIVPPSVPDSSVEIVVDTGRRILGRSAATSPARAAG
jgi:cytochrome b6-f complex iron-sulfur subunit